MISKSKLGAIALIAAIGLATPAAAQTSQYSPSVTGGGSFGYNRNLAKDQWRLKHHPHAHHAAHQAAQKEVNR
jgi:hypothetical protein